MFHANREWELTDDGLRAADDRSQLLIPGSWLTKCDGQANPYYDWPIFIAQSATFDFDLFADAYTAALAKFAKPLGLAIDPKKLEASLAHGRALANRRKLGRLSSNETDATPSFAEKDPPAGIAMRDDAGGVVPVPVGAHILAGNLPGKRPKPTRQRSRQLVAQAIPAELEAGGSGGMRSAPAAEGEA
jgi:hypothetical protein